MSAQTQVNSCRASSRVQPSATSFAILFQRAQSACMQEFLGVCCAQASGGRQGLRAEVQDLFIKCLEDGKVRVIAKRDGIAKHGLLACEPGCIEADPESPKGVNLGNPWIYLNRRIYTQKCKCWV